MEQPGAEQAVPAAEQQSTAALPPSSLQQRLRNVAPPERFKLNQVSALASFTLWATGLNFIGHHFQASEDLLPLAILGMMAVLPLSWLVTRRMVISSFWRGFDETIYALKATDLPVLAADEDAVRAALGALRESPAIRWLAIPAPERFEDQLRLTAAFLPLLRHSQSMGQPAVTQVLASCLRWLLSAPNPLLVMICVGIICLLPGALGLVQAVLLTLYLVASDEYAVLQGTLTALADFFASETGGIVRVERKSQDLRPVPPRPRFSFGRSTARAERDGQEVPQD